MKAMLAWHREMDTSGMRNVLSLPRPIVAGFPAKDIACTTRSRLSPTVESKTINGGVGRGSSTSGARSPDADVKSVGRAALHNSQVWGL